MRPELVPPRSCDWKIPSNSAVWSECRYLRLGVPRRCTLHTQSMRWTRDVCAISGLKKRQIDIVVQPLPWLHVSLTNFMQCRGVGGRSGWGSIRLRIPALKKPRFCSLVRPFLPSKTPPTRQLCSHRKGDAEPYVTPSLHATRLQGAT